MSASRLVAGGQVLVALAAVALVILSVLAATGYTEGLDDRASRLFRPTGQLETLQSEVDVIVEGLRPRNTAGLLALVTCLVAVRRWSWRPVACAGLVCGSGVAITIVLKWLVGRVDSHGDRGLFGGAYPSGHVVMVLMAAGCVVFLLRDRPGPLAWSLIASAGVVMGGALLVQSAHWLTDVIGALLVGTVVLWPGRRLPFRAPTAASAPTAPGPPLPTAPRPPTTSR